MTRQHLNQAPSEFRNQPFNKTANDNIYFGGQEGGLNILIRFLCDFLRFRLIQRFLCLGKSVPFFFLLTTSPDSVLSHTHLAIITARHIQACLYTTALARTTEVVPASWESGNKSFQQCGNFLL